MTECQFNLIIVIILYFSFKLVLRVLSSFYYANLKKQNYKINFILAFFRLYWPLTKNYELSLRSIDKTLTETRWIE